MTYRIVKIEAKIWDTILKTYYTSSRDIEVKLLDGETFTDATQRVIDSMIVDIEVSEVK